MFVAMAGLDHAKALEEVRPPPLTRLRTPVAEVSWSPASSCSRPSALRHLLRQAFTVFDQKAQDTGALTGNVSSRCAHHLPRSFLAPARRHASAVLRT